MVQNFCRLHKNLRAKIINRTDHYTEVTNLYRVEEGERERDRVTERE